MRFLTQQFGYWGYAIRRFLEENQGEGSSSEAYGGYSAIVYIDGSSVIARDYKGNIIASGTAGTDDVSVINSAVSSLSTIGKRLLYFDGAFHIDSAIEVTVDNGFLNFGNSIFYVDTNDCCFKFNGATGSIIDGGYFIGNASYTGIPIKIISGTGFLFGTLKGYDLNNWFLYIDKTAGEIYDIVVGSAYLTTCKGFLYARWTSGSPGVASLSGQFGLIRFNPGTTRKTDGQIIKLDGIHDASFTNIIGGSYKDCVELNNCKAISLGQLNLTAWDEGYALKLTQSGANTCQQILIGQLNSIDSYKGVYIQAIKVYMNNVTVIKSKLEGVKLEGSTNKAKSVFINNIRIGDSNQNSQSGIYDLVCDTDGIVSIKNGIIESTNPDANISVPSNNNLSLDSVALYNPNSNWTNKPAKLSRVNIGGKWSEAEGSATIANGNTSVTVNHGLADTPTNIQLTGTHSEVKDAYVTNPGATSFTIQVDSAVTADRVVHWRAKV